MEKGRGRQLNLSPLGQSAVHRHNFLNRRPLQRQDFLFLLFGEPSVFRPECSESGIPCDGAIAKPGEVEPHLKIEQVLCGELTGEPWKILSIDVQLPV